MFLKKVIKIECRSTKIIIKTFIFFHNLLIITSVMFRITRQIYTGQEPLPFFQRLYASSGTTTIDFRPTSHQQPTDSSSQQPARERKREGECFWFRYERLRELRRVRPGIPSIPVHKTCSQCLLRLLLLMMVMGAYLLSSSLESDF